MRNYHRKLNFIYLKENKDQKKTIEQLESLLEEEITLRKEDLETFTVTIETEVQERIFHDRKLTTVVNEETDNGHQFLQW